MKHAKAGSRALGAFALLIAFSVQLAAQGKPSGSFLKDVMAHQAEIQWITYKTPTLPDDVCTLLSACGGAPAKVAALPVATIHGRKTGRALFLTEVKKQPAIVLEHQTLTETYFFLLAPDGSLQKAAYFEPGKSYLVIANSLAQPTFQADMKDWQAWVAKPTPAKGN